MIYHKIFVILIVFVIFLFGTLDGEAQQKVDKKITITAVNNLSVYEVWNSTTVERVAVGDVVVALYKFDVEALPLEGNQQSLAVILVGESGTGINPVGLKINSTEVSSVKIVKISNDVKSSSFEIVIGTNIKYKLLVTSDKKVFIDSKFVGSIQ
jgi:hypothetical protein